MRKASTTHSRREDAQDWVCKACFPTAIEATTLIAHRLFEREGSCIAKRSWQEHSSHTDVDAAATGACSRAGDAAACVVKVATESNPADMLTKALGRS